MSSAQDSINMPVSSNKDGEYADAERNYQPKSLKFWVIIIGVILAMFLVALDRLIIATAIPQMTDEFHSIQDIAWYGTAYMLTAAIFNPFSGRLYQLYSTKWLYLGSILVFEVGSALCGAAPSSSSFIVGRAIAGIGAAGITCGGMMIVIPIIPLRKRPLFVSLFGMTFAISSIVGPVIGGSFTDNKHLTWRWCFFINLPIGAFTFFGLFLFLHLETPPREKLTIWDQLKRLDPFGLLLFVPSIVALVLALQWGGTTYPWSSPTVIGLLVTFAVLLLAFLALESLTPQTAMIPTRVVLNRSVAGAMLFVFLLSGGMMAIFYYLSTWFQVVQDQSAVEAGIRTIPLLLAFVIMGLAAATFVQKIGYYVPAMLLSPVLCAVGAGMLSTITPQASKGQWIGYQVLYGVGVGCGFQTSNLVPQTVLPRVDVPIGVAMMFFMQQLGGSVFLAVGQNIFSKKLIVRLSDIADLDPQTILNTGATALRGIVPASELGNVVNAYSYSLTRVFVVSAGLSAAMILGSLMLEWKSIKGDKERCSKGDEPNGKPEAADVDSE